MRILKGAESPSGPEVMRGSFSGVPAASTEPRNARIESTIHEGMKIGETDAQVQADEADEEDAKSQVVDAPRVVPLPLTSWRFKTGLTNLSTECIKRMYDRGIFCPKDNVVYTVAWPRF